MSIDCEAMRLGDGAVETRLPAPLRPFGSDAIEVVVSNLDVEPEAVCACAAVLSDAERQRASRFHFDRDRRRFTVARARLRGLLAARLGVRPQEVALVYGAHGKPALCGYYADLDLRFNVSHAEDVAVYAFSQGREIGVDIEFVRPIASEEDIAARFFSASEHRAYLALHPDDRSLGFFNCWTRKEAFLKALGTGLDYPLDSFDVSLAPGDPAKILRVEHMSGKCSGWTLYAFMPQPDLVGAVAVQKLAAESASMSWAGRGVAAPTDPSWYRRGDWRHYDS